jgi:hypothetical protein
VVFDAGNRFVGYRDASPSRYREKIVPHCSGTGSCQSSHNKAFSDTNQDWPGDMRDQGQTSRSQFNDGRRRAKVLFAG